MIRHEVDPRYFMIVKKDVFVKKDDLHPQSISTGDSAISNAKKNNKRLV